MKDRVHILLPSEEKDRYRSIAEQEGTTLSRWIREAVRERAAKYDVARKLDTVEDLEAFFLECDQLSEAAPRKEPDWEEHERLIHESRGGGLDAQ
jgi:hypothetical protein